MDKKGAQSVSYLLIRGDAKKIPLEDKSVQMCVCSPPYWGLRDYGVDGQLGLEATPCEFVENMVVVFREVRRVLRDDGTLWLNIGDSFCNDTKWGGSGGGPNSKNYTSGLGGCVGQKGKRNSGLKPKDLCMMPARLALAMQDDGWWIRQKITWCKTSPMPSPVADRPTSATEELFLMTKSQKYYYDIDATRVPCAAATIERDKSTRITKGKDGPYSVQHDHETPSNPLGRNMWNYWLISAENYRGAHFSTYPKKLVEPCIKAGSKPGDIVLDPFSGASTTGVVALALNRRYVGLDLSIDYLAMSQQRIEKTLAPPKRRPRKTESYPLFNKESA
jgi:DNA modification methylase